MKFTLTDLLKLLPMVGPTIARTREFAERFETLIAGNSEAEQAELREALEDIRADNDEGHERLQAKLKAGAER